MLRYALVLIVCEKIVQHVLVTFAFWQDTGDIRSTVAIAPDVLMILGAVVAFLFVVALWAILRKLRWVPDLLVGLALFDILGEFAAQGTIAITITISLLVAILLLVLAIFYRRQLTQPAA